MEDAIKLHYNNIPNPQVKSDLTIVHSFDNGFKINEIVRVPYESYSSWKSRF